MKKLLITSAAAVGLAAGASAQGLIDFDNTAALYGYAESTHANYYDSTSMQGALHIQVWSLAGSTQDALINAGNGGVNANLAGYNLMKADGYVLDATFNGVTLSAASDQGGKALGPVTLSNVTAPNAQIAIVAWTGAGAYGVIGTWGGTIEFHESDVVAIASPQGPPSDISQGWNSLGSDLLMTQVVPEPGTFALLGLGSAALLIFRRRK